MRELIAEQHVRRRGSAPRLASSRLAPRRPELTPPKFRIGKKLRDVFRSLGARFAAFPRRFLLLVILAVVFVFGGLAVLFASPWRYDLALSHVREASDPSLARYMQQYVGLGAAEDVTITTDDGAKIVVSELFSIEAYTVAKGDTLSKIATAHSLEIGSIIAMNRNVNVKHLSRGTVLKLPNMDGVPYTVHKGDVLGKIARVWGVPLEAILDANDLTSETINPGTSLFIPGAKLSGEDLQRALGELFIYPIFGRFTSGFGWRNDPFTGARRFHPGIDIADPIGTPVKAARDGRVAAIGTNAIYGNYIILSHSSGYQTMYAHLSAFKVDKGQQVGQGDRIGNVGTTGYSTGPHLHFGVYKNGRALNPLRFLNK